MTIPSHERAQAARDKKHIAIKEKRREDARQIRINDRILDFEYIALCQGVVMLVAMSRNGCDFDVWTKNISTGDCTTLFVSDDEDIAHEDYHSVVEVMKAAEFRHR